MQENASFKVRMGARLVHHTSNLAIFSCNRKGRRGKRPFDFCPQFMPMSLLVFNHSSRREKTRTIVGYWKPIWEEMHEKTHRDIEMEEVFS